MQKKILLLALLLLPCLLSYGQHKKKKQQEPAELPPPRVWIANVPSYTTTHDLVVLNDSLTTDSVGCRVSGFTVSLVAPGHPFYGPLYSNTWKMTEVQKGVIKTWDYPNVTLYVQDIHLNCHEKDATSPPLTYHYGGQ